MDVFRREIGLKSLATIGVSTFGIRVMHDPLTLLRRQLFSNKLSHKLQKSCLITGEVAFVNSLLNPSGPGDL